MRWCLAVFQLYQSSDFLRLFLYGEAQENAAEKVITNIPIWSELRLKRSSAKRIDELEARLASIEAFMKKQLLPPKQNDSTTQRSKGKDKAEQNCAAADGYMGTTEAAGTLESESNGLTPTSMCDKSSCAGASPDTIGCSGSSI
jgi:hypothetical protein